MQNSRPLYEKPIVLTTVSPPSPLSSRGFVARIGLHQIACWGTLTYGVTIFGPSMAARAGVSVSSVIAAYALGLLFNGFVGPVATRFVMRGRAWSGGLLGLGLGAAACGVLAFAANLPTIALGFALAGAAMALTQYDFAWLLVRLYHPHDARRIVTGITLFGALASSVMWPIAQFLNTRFGLIGGWLGLGMIMVIVCALCLWDVTRRGGVPAPQARANTGSLENAPARESTVGENQLRAIVFGLVAVSSIGGAVAINLPLVLAKAQSQPAVIAGVLSLFGIGQLAGRVLDFVGAKKFGLRTTVYVGFACALASWGLLALPQGAMVSALAVLLLGAGNGLFTIVRGATPQLTFFGEQFTHASSALARWGSYARAVLPIAFAWMLESTGVPFAAFALLCVAGIGVGVVCVLRNARQAMRE